jgi:hypothetical protein
MLDDKAVAAAAELLSAGLLKAAKATVRDEPLATVYAGERRGREPGPTLGGARSERAANAP